MQETSTAFRPQTRLSVSASLHIFALEDKYEYVYIGLIIW